MSAVQHVSDSNFVREAVQSPVPLLVDFYADWCRPCRMLGPVLERLAAEFAGKARILQVNVDAAPALAAKFQVESIPTLIFIAGGRQVGRYAGLVSEQALREALGRLVGGGPHRRVG